MDLIPELELFIMRKPKLVFLTTQVGSCVWADFNLEAEFCSVW